MIPSIYLLYATVGFAIAGIGTLAIGRKRQNNNPKQELEPQQTNIPKAEPEWLHRTLSPPQTIPQEALEYSGEITTETATANQKQQPHREKFDFGIELAKLTLEKLRTGEWQPEITLVEDGRKGGVELPGLKQKVDLKITVPKGELPPSLPTTPEEDDKA